MPRISQIAAGAFAAALAFTSVASFAAGSSDPETDQVKSRVVERLGVRPTTVAKTPFGLWEISVAPDQVFYVDGNVRYLLLGNAVDIATRENLTEKRIAEISRRCRRRTRSVWCTAQGAIRWQCSRMLPACTAGCSNRISRR